MVPPAAAAAEGAPDPQSAADYPLGSWMMYQGGPAHLGQAQTAVPPNGRVVWSYINQSSDRPEGGAVVENGTVYAPLGKDLTALNLTNGTRLWSFGATGPIRTTPALWNGTVFFGTDVGNEVHNFFAVNATTGQLLWKVNESSALGAAQFVKSSPVVSDGLVYYGSYTDQFYARHASNGTVAWSAGLSSEVHAAPALDGGLVFVATQGIHDLQFNVWVVPPQIYAFDALSGSPVWNRTVPDGHLSASPVVDGGVVYLVTAGFRYSIAFDAGYLLAINASDGALLWTSSDIGRSVATPALAGRTLYVATAGDIGGPITGSSARLRALDLDGQGSVLWSVAVGTQGVIEGPPTVVLDANGSAAYVAAASLDGTVGVWLASGVSTPLWSHTLPQGVVAPPAVVSEMVLVPSLNGSLNAYGARPDLAVEPSDIRLSDSTPHVGQPVDVEVTVHNLGDKVGSANLTVFLNASGSRSLLFEQRIENLAYQGTGAMVLRHPVVFESSGPFWIEASLTNTTPTGGNLSNNQAVAAFSVLPALAGWAARYADASNSNYFDSPTPENGLPRLEDSYGLAGTGMLALDGAVVFSVGEVIWSVSATNASAVLWSQAPSPAAVVGTPALSSSMLLVATNDSMAWFIDPDDGAVLGSVGLPAPATASPVPLPGGFLVPCSDRLVLISAANRTVERESQAVTVPPAARPAMRSPPAISGSSAFVISSVGELHAFDLATGLELPGFPVTLREPTAVPPVVGASHVFSVNGSLNVSAFPLSPLSPLPAQEFTFAGAVSGPMAYAYGRLFVATAPGNLSVISTGSGVSLFNVTLPAGATAAGVLAVANDTVFLGNETLLALSASDGSTLWSHGFLGRIGVYGPAAIAGGLLHVQTQTGALATFGAIPGVSPVANISSPGDGQTVRVGDQITFSANGSYDPEGTNLTYVWSFGDGEFEAGAVASHAYSFTAAQLRVTLTVMDEQGLSATASITIQSIENAPPVLAFGVDEVSPDQLQGPYLDDTVWTFTVYYADPNGDAPAFVRLHLTNETDPVHEMAPRDAGPHNYSSSVAYIWSGTLSSAIHFWNFTTSDGLAGFTTLIHGPAIKVHRLEVGEAIPVRFSAQYIGQGDSRPYDPRPDPRAPPGVGVLTQFTFSLPTGATDLVYLNLTVAYNLTAANLDDLHEDTIGLFWYNQLLGEWENETDAIDTSGHTVTANLTNDGIFGVFGELRVRPLPPVAAIAILPDKTVFLVGEEIEFSANGSLDQNSNTTQNLTFSWTFDDGTNGSGRTIVHRFDAPGTYNVTLTVTNTFGLTAEKTVPISVRTEESTSTFLAIAAFLVGGLLLIFLLSPVWRRRSRSPSEVRRHEEEVRRAREQTRPRAPPPGRGPGGKKGTGGLSDDERKVVDELEEDFQQRARKNQK
ncbi:MAG TPA: PQQ-binding-like beta-propeller repeat protein [Candidatus Thermoplasmatota archaeon]